MNMIETTDGRSLLEVLRDTRSSLEDKAFNYDSWASCTCGHIYSAATRVDTRSFAAFAYEAHQLERMGDTIVEIAVLLGATGDPEPSAAAIYISHLTAMTASHRLGHSAVHGDQIRSLDALVLIDRAINLIEAREEADRLNVLAQLEEAASVPDEAASAPEWKQLMLA